MIKEITVIRALLNGISIEFGGYPHRLFSPGETVNFPSERIKTGEYFLAIEMTKENAAGQHDVFVGSDISFSQILNAASKMSLSYINELKKKNEECRKDRFRKRNCI